MEGFFCGGRGKNRATRVVDRMGCSNVFALCYQKKHETVRVDAYFIPELRVNFYFYFFRVYSVADIPIAY